MRKEKEITEDDEFDVQLWSDTETRELVEEYKSNQPYFE